LAKEGAKYNIIANVIAPIGMYFPVAHAYIQDLAEWLMSESDQLQAE
jgi:hypothetical protein